MTIADLRYLSICSGIEAATVAWAPLGFRPVAFSEISDFASAVLRHHYPDVPNLGDFTSILTGPSSGLGRVDLLCGGTPCQAFSRAGKRMSLADSRGNLSLAFTVLANELARFHGLRNLLWENVPDVLNTKDNAFGCFLAGLVGANDPLPLPRGVGRWPDSGMVSGPWSRAAWRILDAKHFGLAQRRRRVFLVADFGNGADPAEVLFERESLRRYHPARGKSGQVVAGTLAESLGRRRGVSEGDRGPLIPICFSAKDSGADASIDLSPTRRAGNFTASHANGGVMPAVAFDLRGRIGGAMLEGPHETANIRAASGGSSRSYVAHVAGALPAGANETGGARFPGTSAETAAGYLVSDGYVVRRLTPRECERLQGFSDDYTAIPWKGRQARECPDGPRYQVLGNSWPVPVVRWIGERLAAAMPATETASA